MNNKIKWECPVCGYRNKEQFCKCEDCNEYVEGIPLSLDEMAFMPKLARFLYFEQDEHGKECYVLKTINSQGEDEGIIATYYFTADNNIPYSALLKAVELQNQGYVLEIEDKEKTAENFIYICPYCGAENEKDITICVLCAEHVYCKKSDPAAYEGVYYRLVKVEDNKNGNV